MALPSRQSRPLGTDARLVPLGQGHDQFMHPYRRGSRLHLFTVHLAKTGDVFFYGAIEQLHALGQVAQVRAEFVLVPCVHVHTVQPHFTAGCWPQTHQQARQGGFTRCRWPHHRKDFTRVQRKAEPTHDQRLRAGRTGVHRPPPPGGPLGAGKGIDGARAGDMANNLSRRPQASRALIAPRHWVTI